MKFKNIYSDSDINELASLANNIWLEYWPSRISLPQTIYMIDKFQSFNAIKYQLEHENYIYNIFYDDDNLDIGYFGISIKNDFLFLSKLYIKSDFRGLGCGKLALNKIKQYAQKYNKQYIRLTVNKYNTPSINIYKIWGFSQIDSVITDIGQGFVMDDYIMEYQL